MSGGAGYHSSFPSEATEGGYHRRGPTGVADSGFNYHAFNNRMLTIEERRLEEDAKKQRYWRRWGCYLSERQWVSARLRREY